MGDKEQPSYRKGCIFCEIVKGATPAYVVYETETHLAFLDICPSMPGQSVVLPKAHFSSDVLGMPENDYKELVLAARAAGEKIKRGMGAERVFMVAEGMEVEHAHLKLYPVCEVVKKTTDEETPYTAAYEGYLTTLHGPRIGEAELDELAKKINKAL